MTEVLVVVLGVVQMVSAFLLAAVFYLMWNSGKRYNSPRPEVFDLSKDPNHLLCTCGNAKNEMLRVVKLMPAEPALKRENNHKELEEFLGTPETEESARGRGSIEKLTGSRDDGQLPILVATRVQISQPTNLHVSKLSDLFGNPIYLAMAPLPTQFADHWELIWRENIGVIVWIGRLSGPNDENRMHSYIEMSETAQATYGSFEVKTVKAVDRRMKMAFFHLNVQYQGQTREIVIIHAYEWLQETVPWALRREVEVIVELKDFHIRQMLADLPGVMFQCKWGTAGSAVMAASYIGFQTWLYCGRVNIFAIIQYIRQYRWKAFEATGSSFQTSATQIQIVHAVMYNLAKFISEKRLPLFDEDLKQVMQSRSILLP